MRFLKVINDEGKEYLINPFKIVLINNKEIWLQIGTVISIDQEEYSRIMTELIAR